jgi:uncharacterized membrane protein
MDHQIYYDVDTEAQKNLLWWLYVGHAASVFFSLGLLSFIPLIINYVKRGRTEDSFLYSHHAWQIRSFWWYLVWVGIGGLVALSIIGIPLCDANLGCGLVMESLSIDSRFYRSFR